MATTENLYTGDGSTVLYSFTFPYLEEGDVYVSVDGTDLTTQTEYIFANATTIQLGTAPANGAAVRIYRQTDSADLKAAFFPGSAIRAQDLNDNFIQNLYVTQESKAQSDTATGESEAAKTAAEAAQAAAAAASTDAATAQAAATQAEAEALTAQSQATAAGTSAAAAQQSASDAATEAANAAAEAANAASDSATAQADAATAISTADGAATLAAGADAKADTAIATSNAATATAQGADSKADQSISDAASAVSTANAASSAASQAVTDSATAVANAQTALDAVSNVIDFTLVANVAAIPASPSDAEAVQVNDATGIESFTPLSGVPSGFVGDSGLNARIIYRANVSSWEWISSAPNDSDSRYVRIGSGVSQLANDENFIDAAGAPVQSVNGQTGDVTLSLTASLDDLTDVQVSGAGHTPTDGQALVWNAVHNHWMPGDVTLDIGSLPTLP